MPFFDTIRLGAAGGTAEAYTVNRSLRFNRSDNAYLSRTPSSAGNRKTFTYSVWVKLGQTGTNSSTNQGNGLFLSCGAAGTGTNMTLRITNNGYIGVDYYGIGGYYSTSRLRDLSAWYHCVWVMDTTESTAANRFKVYVNGDLIYNNQLGLSQNADTPFNNNSLHTIGAYAYTTSHSYRLDAYLAEVHFLDGYAYDPTYFAETNSTTGQWNPKKYTGSYGTNGFYLNFSDNSGTTATTLGKDSSGNSNNFTPYNFSVAANLANDSMPDTPTNNFCTLNTLNATSSFNFDIGEGNLVFDQSSNDQAITGTFFITSGKWYWEIYKNASQNPEIGICGQETLSNRSDGIVNRLAFITNGGNLRTGSSSTTSITGGSAQTGAGWIRIACDMDNKKIWFSDTSGNYFNSGNPATGANAAYDFSSHDVANGWVPYVFMGTGSGHNCYMNFGQFELNSFSSNIPTGFATLSSANLPDPTILLPNQHFNTVLYSGDGNATKSITGVGFKPDWLWLKGRNTSYSNLLYNSVVGAGLEKGLNSNEDRAEGSVVGDNSTFGYLNSFDSDGFSVTKGSDSTSYTNGGSSNYVAWNWNAGEADSKTYKVKVVSDSTDYGHGTGSNKYQFLKSDGSTGFGTNGVDLDLEEGGTYIFDWSDSSAQLHPIRFSLTNDGTHSNGTSAGTEYTTGVTKDDSAYKTTITIASGVANLFYYCQNHSGMGAEINTNATKGSSNFEGNTQATVKVNATAGFSIISWNARGTSSGTYDTLGHGLGVRPNWLILKSRNNTGNWNVYFSNFGSDAYNKILQLSNTIAETTSSNYWGADNTTPSSTLIHLNQGNYSNSASPPKFIMYAFSEVAGYSKFGTYTGNSSSDGAFVYTGFRPAFVMIKRIDATDHWNITDNKRGDFNVIDEALYANLGSSEDSNSYNRIDYYSNGFKYRANNSQANQGTHIYFAFAEAPFKNARAR